MTNNTATIYIYGLNGLTQEELEANLWQITQPKRPVLEPVKNSIWKFKDDQQVINGVKIAEQNGLLPNVLTQDPIVVVKLTFPLHSNPNEDTIRDFFTDISERNWTFRLTVTKAISDDVYYTAPSASFKNILRIDCTNIPHIDGMNLSAEDVSCIGTSAQKYWEESYCVYLSATCKDLGTLVLCN
jgi:hypothetical protein